MFAARHMTTPAVVRQPLGEGAYGTVLGEPVAFVCWPEEGSKQVRDAGGEEVVSSTRLWCLADAVTIVPGAEVMYAGRTSEVISVALHDPGAIPTGRLLEVVLQ